MKRILLVLFVLACFSLRAQENQIGRSEYYAILPFWESPLTPFKGAVSLTADQAKKRIHMKIDYDQLNRPIVVHVKLGENYKDFEGSFQYQCDNRGIQNGAEYFDTASVPKIK